MNFIKKYFLLIFLALLPFYKLFHFDDYCFGDEDLLVVGALTIVFVVALITIVFNDLYTISYGKELFNFIPLIIAGVFFISLFLGLKLHENSLFKNEFQSFKIQQKDANTSEIKLFKNATFEYKTSFSNYNCVKKGTYFYEKDALFLNMNHKTSKETILDSAYIFNKMNNFLVPKDRFRPKFILQTRE
jgi:hypothetical protein